MNNLDRFQLYGDVLMAIVFTVLSIVCFVVAFSGNRIHFVFGGGCVLITYLMVIEILSIKRKNQ